MKKQTFWNLLSTLRNHIYEEIKCLVKTGNRCNCMDQTSLYNIAKTRYFLCKIWSILEVRKTAKILWKTNRQLVWTSIIDCLFINSNWIKFLVEVFLETFLLSRRQQFCLELLLLALHKYLHLASVCDFKNSEYSDKRSKNTSYNDKIYSKQIWVFIEIREGSSELKKQSLHVMYQYVI